METRAKHITIGAFVLSSALAIAFFVFWLARYQGEATYNNYFVRFSGSVSQLRVDSTVLFGGIPVGRVTDVRIDPENSELARVDLAVREGTPVHRDSRATLELQGIAGGVIVQISRGTNAAELLPADSEITAGPSALEQIVRRVPDLLGKIDEITNRMSDLLSDKNRQALSNSLANLEAITSQLSGEATSAEGVMSNASGAIQELNNAAREFSALAVELRGAVGDVRGDATKAARNFAVMADSFNRTSQQLSTVIDDNREPLKQFSTTTLYETGELVSELRRLVASMTRISHQFEKDPARFLLNDRSTGVDTP
ncbi:MAG TPA: MlaD family protein [Dongiaceae bacterium]|jgi:phospholipid/cholesterol/gamma-HCH transport system substrate-binding protein|nr:MlaD family protein [Dongiaceae bacterium]